MRDPLCEVTTDKVNMEVEAPADDILDGIRYVEGETVAVTGIIAFVLAEGESVPEIERLNSPKREKTVPHHSSSSGNGGKITQQDVRK